MLRKAKEYFQEAMKRDDGLSGEDSAIAAINEAVREAIIACAKAACMTVERKGSIISSKQLGWISEEADHLYINKQSILKILNEIK